MPSEKLDYEKACCVCLDDFFSCHGGQGMERNAKKILRFLVAGEEKMGGKPEGWAAGAVYALANRNKWACGVVGILNADFECFFGVSMSTVRKRAAQVDREVKVWLVE